MKVFITKYALTKGILEAEATQNNLFPSMITAKLLTLGWSDYFHKPHWHETKEAAIARADEMRVKKIKSLRKQIAKLEHLTFA